MQEGARHASRRRELSTGVQVTGFLILLLPWKWERADLWQKVGIWRRIELDAALAASPRQITRRRNGGVKKGKGKREGRGQLDKNRRESNKEWGINKGKGEEKDARMYFIIGKRWKWKGIGLWKWLKRCGVSKKSDEEEHESLWYLDTTRVNIFLKINFNLVLNKEKNIYIRNKKQNSINTTKSLYAKADIKCNDRNNRIY